MRSRYADNELIVDVAVLAFRGKLHRYVRISEELAVAVGVGLALFGPFIQVLQLYRQHRRLQRIQPKVTTDERVIVFRLGSMNAQHFNALGEFVILNEHHAAVACAAQIFGREEGQAPERTHGPGEPSVPLGTDCLGGVFDDWNVAGDFLNARHVRGAPVQMNGHDRLGLVSNRGSQQLRIHIETVRLNIDKDRLRACANDGTRRRVKRVGRSDDFIAWADVQCHQCNQKRVRPRCNPNRVFGIAVFSSFFFEGRHGRAQYEVLGFKDFAHRCFDFFADSRVLGAQIK